MGSVAVSLKGATAALTFSSTLASSTLEPVLGVMLWCAKASLNQLAGSIWLRASSAHAVPSMVRPRSSALSVRSMPSPETWSV